MYRYYVPKRAPLAFWMLDDTVPFQEHSGVSASGGKKTGTSDPGTSIPLVAGAAFSSVFKSTAIGQFSQNVFKPGLENRPFAIEAWVLPIPKTTTGNQQVLSHDTTFDGISINGKVVRFGTSYVTAGDAFCEYDLGEYKLAHVVGTHNADQNQLWVNGELVAAVKITDAQKSDTYVAAADQYLYSGYTTSNQEVAMNGVAIYASLSGDQIKKNYLAGIDVLPQASVSPQFGGLSFNLSSDTGAVFLDQQWTSREDFVSGLRNNVDYTADAITPSYVSGTSIAGSWTIAVPLDARGDTSIYGVMASWSGTSITVAASLNGTSWTTLTSGTLISIISSGYNPTGKDLQIRVSFAGGLTSDPAKLDSLRLIGFRTAAISGSTARPVSVSSPAVVRSDYEPTLYRDDNGATLSGGTLTIGADPTADPDVARTLELWIKPISGSTTISVGGTKYRNGVADTSLPIGEWSLIHYVAAADIAGSITVTGDCIVGQATLYPTALTADEVSFIFKSYTGSAVVRFVDDYDVAVSEGAAPAAIYAHDWSIDSAG